MSLPAQNALTEASVTFSDVGTALWPSTYAAKAGLDGRQARLAR